MSKQKPQHLLPRNFLENGLKTVLENPGNVHDMLQLLDVQLLPRIDFTKMDVAPGCFVARDYRHLESDLVLQAPIRPAEAVRHDGASAHDAAQRSCWRGGRPLCPSPCPRSGQQELARPGSGLC